MTTAADPRFGASVRRLVPLAWPVLVGQVSVLGFATVDTVLVARHASADLAALAIGAAAYVTVFIGFMGAVLALAPIVGQLQGARRFADAGRQLHQAVWIALGLALVGSSLLLLPGPLLALAQVPAEIESKVRGYLGVLAFSLPASLLFTVYRAFNTAVSRPKAVMALQLGGLGLKIPLSMAFVFGMPSLGLPAQGVVGCAVATLLAMWAQALAAWVVLRRDPFYGPYAIGGRPRGWFGLRLDAPERRSIAAQLRLGVPLGLTIVIEITGMTFMAFFIARLGVTAVAGHQIAANLVSLLFMIPLALGNATSTLVAQAIGARDEADARRLGWHGLALALAVALMVGGTVYGLRGPVVGLYTADPAVQAAALALVAWLAWFHLGDAAQTVAAFALRARHVATVPLVIYAVAIWGVGLGGGYVLAFDLFGITPAALRGAPGFWAAAAFALSLAGLLLVGLLAWLLRRR